MNRRQFVSAAVAAAVSLVLAGCGDKAPQELKVAAKSGLKVKVVEFTDYITPNRALADKALDVNVYQHEPFLKNFNKNQNTNLVKVADAVVQPMGLYSDTVKSLEAVPEGAKIAIPNDPTNGGRALVLLKAAGLIELKPGVTGTTATVADITANPKAVKVVELEAAQLPRSLEDVDVACVPMNYAISGKLSPEKQGFYFESREAPFALMVIAARPDNAEAKNVQAFVKAYQSPEVKAFIEKTFNGAVKAAW